MPRRPPDRPPTNVAASIHQRILNVARTRGRPFNEVVHYYAMERILARILHTEAADRFVLKGALALRTWLPTTARATRDIDLLALAPAVEFQATSPAPATRSAPSSDMATWVSETLRTCLGTSLPTDGVVFDAESAETYPITAQTDEAGMRITCRGRLGTVRLTMQIDVGFGDVTEPMPLWVEYPQLLDPTPLRVLAYRRETIVAEKFHVIVARGTATSRFKDFYDVWCLLHTGQTESDTLRHAIQATFAGRASPLPATIPTALTSAFATEPMTRARWEAFWRKSGATGQAPSFTTIVEDIAAWLLPLAQRP